MRRAPVLSRLVSRHTHGMLRSLLNVLPLLLTPSSPLPPSCPFLPPTPPGHSTATA
ncbi:hypothetical protein E2C01_099567 [Portunus trituberculatus]|uniref:Uncharacterized protein n=1 Tax=Portunus trituberculatus TaxID=210409 RepID=A0A5B7KFP4_PORTR|nr:hypothetical protein [Portunus trituberculatus]